jgi:hypothetical protein
MKKITIILIATSFISLNSYAKTIISTRNTYESKTHKNINRLELYKSFDDGLYFNILSNIQTNKNLNYQNTGISGGYENKLNNYLKYNAGIEYQFSETKKEISPYYKIELIKGGFYSSLKYKYNYNTNGKTLNSTDFENGIRMKNYYALIDLDYLSSNEKITKNKKENLDYGINLGLKVNNIEPYIEIEKVPVDTKTSQKQVRYRLGVKYIF